MSESPPLPPSMPTHSAMRSLAAVWGRREGTLNVPVTDVNGPSSSTYPDQFNDRSVETEEVAGKTTMDSVADAASGVSEASTTCTVKLGVPLSLGVPEIVPADVSVNPAGSTPLVTVHA